MSWYRETIDKIPIPELIPELDPKESANYYTVRCPSCGKHEAFIYKGNPSTIACNRRNNCGSVVSLYDYLIGREGSKTAAYQFIAGRAGVDAPTYSPERQAEVDREERRESLLQKAVILFLSLLPSSETERYLIRRGFRPEDIETLKWLGIGHFPGATETIASLTKQGFGREEINEALNFIGAREGYGLTIPMICNRKVVSVAMRYTGADPEAERYKPLFSYQKGGGMFFFDALVPGDISVITEGPLDALALIASGIPAIAVGTSRITGDQIEALLARKTKTVVLALDTDPAGREGTDEAIEALSKAGIKPYIADYGAYKDPGEAVAKLGSDAVKGLFSNPKTAGDYSYDRLFSGYETKTTVDRDKALDAAIDRLTLFGRTDPFEAERFSKKIFTGAGVTLEAVEAAVEKRRRALDAEEEQKKKARASRDIAKDFETLPLPKALEAAETKIRILRSSLPITAPAIVPMTIRETLAFLDKQPKGLATGFGRLDEHVTIKPGAVTVIAGMTGHGKTTFMLNLFANMFMTYRDKTFLFLTYEETREKLVGKLLKVLAFRRSSYGVPNREETIGYWEVEEVKGRIGVIDLSNESSVALASYIGQWTRNYPIGAIFLDYVQKIPIEGNGRNDTRQLELQKTSHAILTTAKAVGIPLIVGAQLNRELGKKGRSVEDMDVSYIREAGDIGQDANLVLGVWNHAGEKEAETQSALTVVILKNREGPVYKRIELTADWAWLGLRE